MVLLSLVLPALLALGGCAAGGASGGGGGSGGYAGGPNPVPSIVFLDPSSVAMGGPDFYLTVYGSGFSPSSVVQWNGSTLATTFVSGTLRSEERRVGKECRSRWWTYHEKKKKNKNVI